MASSVDSTEEILTYIKEGVDYSQYIAKFLDDERSFYSIIEAFSKERSTILRILNTDGKRISSAVLLTDSDSHTVLEVKRVSEQNFERKNHDSIVDWYEDVYGEDTDITELFDNITIGTGNDEGVPLWRVLETAMDTDDDEVIQNLLSRQPDFDAEFDSIITQIALVIMLLILYSIYGVLVYKFINSK